MKAYKIIYWIATGLLSLLLLMAAGMYIFNHGVITETVAQLGYPTYIVYPLAIAKILGVIVILTKPSRALKEWAYAGFFYVFVLAALAHSESGIGSPVAPLFALVLLVVSYFLDKKISNGPQIL